MSNTAKILYYSTVLVVHHYAVDTVAPHTFVLSPFWEWCVSFLTLTVFYIAHVLEFFQRVYMNVQIDRWLTSNSLL